MKEKEINYTDVVRYITKSNMDLMRLISINKILAYEIELKYEEHNKIMSELL